MRTSHGDRTAGEIPKTGRSLDTAGGRLLRFEADAAKIANVFGLTARAPGPRIFPLQIPEFDRAAWVPLGHGGRVAGPCEVGTAAPCARHFLRVLRGAIAALDAVFAR